MPFFLPESHPQCSMHRVQDSRLQTQLSTNEIPGTLARQASHSERYESSTTLANCQSIKIPVFVFLAVDYKGGVYLIVLQAYQCLSRYLTVRKMSMVMEECRSGSYLLHGRKDAGIRIMYMLKGVVLGPPSSPYVPPFQGQTFSK